MLVFSLSNLDFASDLYSCRSAPFLRLSFPGSVFLTGALRAQVANRSAPQRRSAGGAAAATAPLFPNQRRAAGSQTGEVLMRSSRSRGNRWPTPEHQKNCLSFPISTGVERGCKSFRFAVQLKSISLSQRSEPNQDPTLLGPNHPPLDPVEPLRRTDSVFPSPARRGVVAGGASPDPPPLIGRINRGTSRCATALTGKSENEKT